MRKKIAAFPFLVRSIIPWSNLTIILFLLKVIHHQKLGQSKEEFLHLNGPYMATCNYVLLVLTEHATNSPFVFHEMLFADWLGKKIIVALFKNDWLNLRPSMKAVIG